MKNPYNEDISDGELAFGLLLSTSIEESKRLAGNYQDLKEVADFMKKFSSNIDNLKYLDEQEALMKAFRTDAKIAEEKAEMTGLKKGEKLGLEKGKKENTIENAKNAIAIGLKNEDISKITGLSIEEIENLR